MASNQARDRLLLAAVDSALAGGIADLSLREIAAAIGTSHRMLIYHFGSREGLLVAVARAVEETERNRLRDAIAAGDDPRRFWQQISDPKLWPQERLFFELYAHALLGRPGTDEFLEGIVDDWMAPQVEAMIDAGADEETARTDARLGVAIVRGLLLDLLATGDRADVDQAFERFLELMTGRLAPDD